MRTHAPARVDARARLDRLANRPVATTSVRTAVDAEARRRPADVLGRLEAESVADLQSATRRRRSARRARTPTTVPSSDAAIVGLRARDVVAPRAAAVHAAGEAAAEDLHERLRPSSDVGGVDVASLDAIEELAIAPS